MRDGDHEALAEWGPQGLGESQDHTALGCSLLPRGLGSRRDFARKKEEEGLLLVSHEKVPHGFGLPGDCSSHPADGARSLNHGLLLLFLRYGTWTGQRGNEGLCASVGILKDFSIFNEDIKSLL